MMNRIVIAVACAVGLSVSSGAADTVSDLTPRTDMLTTTYLLDLGQIDGSGPASATAELALWNSNGTNSPTNPQMVLEVFVNSSFVTTVGLTNSNGFSETLNTDVAGALVNGTNDFTFSIFQDFTSGLPATFAVRNFSVDFTAGMAPVPVPAALPLALAGLLGLFGVARLRTSKCASKPRVCRST